MAVVKPIGLSVPAFDATSDYTFEFQSQGGNQVVKNKLTIKNNLTEDTVYEQTIESYAYKHTIPANTLSNGNYYNYSFVTYDKNDTESSPSTPISFYCYTTPVLSFTNISENSVIESSNFNFSFKYEQQENELLDYVIVYLYDIEKRVIEQSGEIYADSAPPNELNYSFEGFLNNTTYYIQLIGRTVNSTIVSTDLVQFTVNYYYPELFNVLDVSNNCAGGNVHITNNTVLVEGESNKEPPDYTDEGKIILDSLDDYVLWNKGYCVGDTFTLEAWLNPVLIGDIFTLWGEDQTKFLDIRLVREIPYQEIEYKDSLELRFYNNTSVNIINNAFASQNNYLDEENVLIYKFSDYIDLLNNLSDIVVWIRKTQDNIEVKLDCLQRTPNAISFNEESNVEFNKITDIKFGDITIDNLGFLVWNEVSDLRYNRPTNMFWNEVPEAWGGTEIIETANERTAYYNGYNMGNIINTKIFNGIYEHFNITKNITKEYSSAIPTWDYDTILDCDFNGSLFAGNTDFSLEQINSIKIKRRCKGEFDWITLYDIPINKYEDLTFSVDDFYAPSGKEFEYAIVPVLVGNIEGGYVTNDVFVQYEDCFITDGDQTFRLYSGITYPTNTSNVSVGLLQPYNSKYPVIVTNPIINYQTLGVTAKLLGDAFDNKGTIDAQSIIIQQEKFDAFLNNNKAKIYKDWNGKIFLGVITSSPTYTYSSPNVLIPTVSFTFTEQGKYNNQSDLYNNGLVEVIN